MKKSRKERDVYELEGKKHDHLLELIGELEQEIEHVARNVSDLNEKLADIARLVGG